MRQSDAEFVASIKKSIYQAILDANGNNLTEIAFDVRTSANHYVAGTVVSYNQFFRSIRESARASVALGIRPKEIVPFILPNIVEARTLLYGHNLIGAISYPVSPMMPERRLEQFISDNNIKRIFLLSDYYEKYRTALCHSSLENIVILGNDFPLRKFNGKIISWQEYKALSTYYPKEPSTS